VIALSPSATLVRRYDRDRYVTALFAPAERREALFALYAFNYEVAKTREVVSEPLLGRIRLQWWRENLDAIYAGGAVRHHEVAEPLADCVRRFGLSRVHFDRLIDAREFDLADEPPATIEALKAYCADTSGCLVRLALETFGVMDETAHEAGTRVGIAYALAGLLRAIPFHARAGRSYIPADIAREAGLDPRELHDLKPSPALAQAVERLAERARDQLRAARSLRSSVPRQAVPALLLGPLAEASLKALARARYNPFDLRLAAPAGSHTLQLTFAALRGRY
jgi:NADH dehydrogenase [ubiquinone] 1 alpha subcomplex assembly factor 6